MAKKRKRKKKFVPTESKLEQEVGAILRRLGYKHVKQCPIFSQRKRCRGIFDFFLTVHKVAIEVNGTYWHCDPRVYKDGPQYTTQRRNIRSWNRKMRYCEQLGIHVIVLWEKDLREAHCMYSYVRDTVRKELDDKPKKDLKVVFSKGNLFSKKKK